MGNFFSRQETFADAPKPTMVLDFYPPLSGKSAVDDLAYAETLDNYNVYPKVPSMLMYDAVPITNHPYIPSTDLYQMKKMDCGRTDKLFG